MHGPGTDSPCLDFVSNSRNLSTNRQLQREIREILFRANNLFEAFGPRGPSAIQALLKHLFARQSATAHARARHRKPRAGRQQALGTTTRALSLNAGRRRLCEPAGTRGAGGNPRMPRLAPHGKSHQSAPCWSHLVHGGAPRGWPRAPASGSDASGLTFWCVCRARAPLASSACSTVRHGTALSTRTGTPLRYCSRATLARAALTAATRRGPTSPREGECPCGVSA